MSKWTRAWLNGLLACCGLAMTQLALAGNVTFTTGKVAVAYPDAAAPTSVNTSGSKTGSVPGTTSAPTVSTKSTSLSAADPNWSPEPGVIRAIMPPVSLEDARRITAARTFSSNLNQGGSTTSPSRLSSTTTGPGGVSTHRVGGDNNPLGPASIPELARSLRNHPDLIYQYIRNNVEYYPVWGIQKGAIGTVLDNQGTTMDQATLMVELLRASGYTANYVRGVIRLDAQQVKDWFGFDTSNVCAVLNLLGQGQIPIASISATQAGSCPGLVAPLTELAIEHVWVKAQINGSYYVFDPSFKPHTTVAGVNLAAAMGYDPTTYLNAARTGATITGDYVQNMNRTNVRNNLNTYAVNLANWLRANKPAATLDDMLGGKIIVPFLGAALRQTTLPYQHTGYTTIETADIAANYKPTLRVRYQGIDQTFTSDYIYGKRLTITYNASNQPVLSLDGVAVGAPGTAVAPGAASSITLTVTHNAYAASASSNREFNLRIRGGGTYAISNGWGPVGRGLTQHYLAQLNNLRAAGVADASESVLGTTLNLIGAQWMAQTTHSGYLSERISDTVFSHHHKVGISGYGTSAYVDFPSNAISMVSPAADVLKERAAFANWSSHSSILESTAVQQTTTVPAVSTVKLLDLAMASGQKIYNATSSNYASAVLPNLVQCGAHTAAFQAEVNAGRRVITPTRCDITENSWSGVGYMVTGRSNGVNYMAHIISDGLSGGYSTYAFSAPQTNLFTSQQSPAPQFRINYSGNAYGDPVDMVKGNYLYEHEDINVGVGSFPQSLSFQRLYSSGMRTQTGPLGKGWTHNLSNSIAVGSDGFQGMGEDSALDAASSIVEHKASHDLLTDDNLPVDKILAVVLGNRWFGDQITDNTIVVNRGLNGEVFVKLPDGTYNPPPGSAVRLIKNADNTYTYETLNRAKLKFNTAGKAETYTEPNGIQVKFTYSGNDLAQVQNSLGRTLNFTYSGGRITMVSDGIRFVGYAYDTADNLSSFTNLDFKKTTYQYDLPGRMASLFYPSFPTTPVITNVYDSLGRVKTQTNARGQLYSYYFSGYRTEEIGPENTARTNYLDVLGNVLQSSTPAGYFTINVYDGQSRLIKKTFPEGNSIVYTYADATCASAEKRCTHNVASMQHIPKPGAALTPITQQFTYESAFNKVSAATDARGKTTTYTYTAQGDPLTVTSPVNVSGVFPQTVYGYTAFTATGYPAFYLPTAKTTRINNVTNVTDTTTYDVANGYVPKTSVMDAGTGKLNLTTTFAYDQFGNLTSVNGPRTDVNDLISRTYDWSRRVVYDYDANGKAQRSSYDADGRVITIAKQFDRQWMTTCRRYSVTGKVIREWGPALTAASDVCPAEAAPVAVTDITYDALDRQQRVTQTLAAAEGGNRITETVYYPDDSVKAISRGVDTALQQTYARYSYTPNGKVSDVADAKNNLTTYQYDGLDRLEKTYYPHPTLPNSSLATDYEQNTYDANGNVVSLRKRNGQVINHTYDNLNRLIARTFANAADNMQYIYDLRNLRTAAYYSNGSHTIYYTWDNAGRLLNTTAAGKAINYQYDPAGNRIRTTWPDAFYVTTGYDAMNRPTGIWENGNAASALATYTYDDLSRRAMVTLGNGTSTQSLYNNQGTLASLEHFLAGTAQDVKYTYTRNQVQDITQNSWTNNLYQWSGGPVGTKSYASNPLNQYTTVAGINHSYDGNGNLSGDGTWTYSYDVNNRLRSANKTGFASTLNYDPEGRLIQTNLGGTVTNLLYDGDELVAEYDGASALQKRYVHGPGIDEPIVQYDGAGTTSKSWFHADHQGSIVATSNTTGASTATYTYGPYGEPNVATGTRFRYTGQQWIGPLGLYYYKARFYSPTLGRFLQTDPIGYRDDMNLYGYVGGNPVNYTDPTGEWGVAGAVWGGVVGGLSGGMTGYLQDGYRGAAIGAVTGLATGAVTGAVAPAAAALAGGRAAGAASTFVLSAVGNAAQQTLTNQAYQSVDPQKVSPISYGAMAGAALGGPAASKLANAASAYAGAVAQTAAAVFGATMPRTAMPVATTTVGKAGAALYEASVGAVSESLGGLAFNTPQNASSQQNASVRRKP